MLYHFPDESPEDLRQKENETLKAQIEKAKRVEKHGYRKKEPSLPSFFVEWNIIHKYLGCPITKWKWPTTSKDKVELEPLPTEFLPPLWSLKPLQFYDPESKEYVRRIVGFREIQKKREYIEYLKEIERELGDDDDADEDDPEGERGGLVRINMENAEEAAESDESDVQAEGMQDEGENVVATVSNKTFPVLRLARGGGKKDKDKDKGDKEGNKGKKEKGTKGEKGGDKGKKKDKKDKGKDKKGKKNEEGGKKEGIFKRIWKYFVGDKDKKDKKGKDKGKDKKEKEKAAEKAKKEKEEKEKAKKEAKSKNIDSHGWLGISKFWKELEKQKLVLEKEHQQNLEQIFKYHGLFRVHAARERDSEWLELSYTDPEESEREIKSFGKPQADWMKPGISFESQNLVRTLRVYTIFTKLTGRSFLKARPDDAKGHMDFTHRKRDVILFFLTSIMAWICFCLLSLSFVDIQAENQATGVSKTGGAKGKATSTNQDLVDVIKLDNAANQAKHDVEELMLNLYEIPLYVVLINLVLVSLWSILVILGDGIFIAHYFNCWCAALAEMETSGCLGIKTLIVRNHIFFLCYASINTLMFYFDYPKHVRYSNLMIISLMMRPFKPYLRINTDKQLLPYMIGGMVFQIYIMYCAMMIKTLMAILATILKNASEMWNFKFALTFQQLATKNRGQLLRMGLNHSLLKLFTHHRILTVLLRNYGEVFSIPIMMYMVMEMGVITIALVRWFFYKAETAETYGGNEFVIINTKLVTSTQLQEEIRIPYFHSRAEVHITLYLMMIQLMMQFMDTTDILARAGDSFFAGYEFVRRSGTILCHSSHQRRLIQSLEWSFSSTNPSVLSANSYFAINRASILSSFAAVAGFFSLIIQLQVQQQFTQIVFNDEFQCNSVDKELYRGECVEKDTREEDNSVLFR